MVSMRSVLVAAAVQLLALAAFAQSAQGPATYDPRTPAPGEFGRVSAGDINAVTKHSSGIMGSIGMSVSQSRDPLSLGSRRGYQATAGGTAVEDRVWFFASAQQFTPSLTSTFANAMPAQSVRGLDAKATAQIGDRNNFVASFTGMRPVAAPATLATQVPASLFSLHYTGVVSSNMFFTAHVSRSGVTTERVPLDLVQQ